jgi:hypothetical protein
MIVFVIAITVFLAAVLDRMVERNERPKVAIGQATWMTLGFVFCICIMLAFMRICERQNRTNSENTAYPIGFHRLVTPL